MKQMMHDKYQTNKKKMHRQIKLKLKPGGRNCALMTT